MDDKEIAGWVLLITALVNMTTAVINLIDKRKSGSPKKKNRKRK